MRWIWLLGHRLPTADTLHSTLPHFGGKRNAKGAWKVGLRKGRKDLEKKCVSLEVSPRNEGALVYQKNFIFL